MTEKGFTLLELLVALAVFAVMAVAAYSGLDSVLVTRAMVEQEARRLQQVQMAFWFLERDLEQAVSRGIRDEFGQARPALASGGSDEELVTFTRSGWDNPLGQRRAALQRLAYRLDPEAGLIRMYWPTLDRSGLAEPRQAVLLERVTEARMRFLDEADVWQSEWPPRGADETLDRLPRAVEITLVLSDWGELTRLLRLVEEVEEGPTP